MAIYAFGLVALYSASATYHVATCAPETLVVLRKIDHGAIFLLIASCVHFAVVVRYVVPYERVRGVATVVEDGAEEGDGS